MSLIYRGKRNDSIVVGEIDSEGKVWRGQASEAHLLGWVDAQGHVLVGNEFAPQTLGWIDAEGEVLRGDRSVPETVGRVNNEGQALSTDRFAPSVLAETEPPSREGAAAFLLLFGEDRKAHPLLEAITTAAVGVVVDEVIERRQKRQRRRDVAKKPTEVSSAVSPAGSFPPRVVGLSRSTAGDIVFLNDLKRTTMVHLTQGYGETALELNQQLRDMREAFQSTKPSIVAVGGGRSFLVRALRDIDSADLFIACSDRDTLHDLGITIIDERADVTYDELLRVLSAAGRGFPSRSDILSSQPPGADPGYTLQLGKDPLRITYEDAQAVIAGYCFAQIEGNWSGSGPQVRRWAYRAYDCVPASIGQELSTLDLLAPVALNAGQKYGARLLEHLQGVAPRVIGAMRHVPNDAKFWEIPRGEIQPEGTPPPDSVSAALHASWEVLMSVPDCGPTITNKILHHKWPTLFPLVDSRTSLKFEQGRAWVNIHDDLARHADAFADLESWFDALCRAWPDARPIGRLRMHDILLWCDATDQLSDARNEGRRILETSRREGAP